MGIYAQTHSRARMESMLHPDQDFSDPLHWRPDYLQNTLVELAQLYVAGGQMPKLLPNEKGAELKTPEPYLAPSPGHHQQWIQACKTGSKTGSNFGYAGPFTEIVLLGNVAFRTGKTIEYDPSTMKIT